MTDRVPLDIAARICDVQPGTIRRWVHDGRLTRHWNGYDFHDLIKVRDARHPGALSVRAGVWGDEGKRLRAHQLALKRHADAHGA